MAKEIIIFTNFFPPHIGGVEYYSRGLAEFFSDKGFSVVIVTTTKGYMRSDNYKVIVLDSIDVLNGRYSIILPSQKNRRAFRGIRKKIPAGAIVQTRFYILSIIAVTFLHRLGTPFILIDHGTGHFNFSNTVVNKLGEWYEHILTKYIMRKCENFYGVSNACCKWLSHFDINAKGVLHNSVRLDDFKPTENLEDSVLMIGENEIERDKVKIVFIGRLIPEKGIKKLVSAFLEIYRENDEIHLYVAGTGELYEEYKDRQIKGITFLGNVQHNDIIKLLSQSDIFCFPSDYPEGLPTTILEAAATKTFIISSRSGGTEEFIINDNYGILLNENSVSEITDVLKKYIYAPEERRRIAENAYCRVKESFSWEVVGEKVIDALGV